MKEGFADARETGEGEEDVKATIVVGGGGEIETSGAMLGPRLAGEGRVKGDDDVRVGREDEWDVRQSCRGHDGDHGRRRERG